MLLAKMGLQKPIHYLLVLLAAGTLVVSPANAQISNVDPNYAIDADLGNPPAGPDISTQSAPMAQDETFMQDGAPTDAMPADGSDTQVGPEAARVAVPTGDTYQGDDLIGAAEGVFGKGAQGLALLIEDILKKQGRPNGYIVGREGGGAFLVGIRYGSGTLNHRVEGEKPVYWTGPSIGPDAGANGGNTFILVYNLYDTEDIYGRFPAAEGAAYLGGGFNASYLRRGDVVLIPIRVGAGLRLGANVGYMRFSKKQRWLPF
ncbi:DUF1134 domain-containing protein [Sphingorhabdus sp. EL138]|uniref:DUF1134 domain-containing protein n=1 Tax=Sphingorhabdus sp. EL138 TaxID=2073156 RepID=UPI0025E76B21|nr:DUF1134 domain-containing protein [Sphingorhabdus sp. EL138]